MIIWLNTCWIIFKETSRYFDCWGLSRICELCNITSICLIGFARGSYFVRRQFHPACDQTHSCQIFLSEIFLSEIFLSEIFLSEIFLSEIFFSEIFLSEIFLSEIFLSSVMRGEDTWTLLLVIIAVTNLCLLILYWIIFCGERQKNEKISVHCLLAGLLLGEILNILKIVSICWEE